MTTTLETRTAPLPPPATGPTPYHLTAEQVRFFDENGYLVLRNWIIGDLLRRLQEAGSAWIEEGMKTTPNNPETPDYAFANRGDRHVFYRVDYLHSKGQAVSLEMLGSPQVLAVAESLCGPNFVPTYESMVFKQEGDGEAISWHQDATHPRKYRIFNYDLYLDASKIGAGALRVIPKSQFERQDICAAAANHGWDAPGVIQVEMEPGDVLLHDVMVIHGSEHTEGKAQRRTIYYEFRPAEEILEDGPWDRNWIDRRLRLLPVALRRYQSAYPDAPPFAWNAAPEFRPLLTGDEETELRVVHTDHTPGSYCSAGSAGKS